ncbi:MULTISPECIES: DUF397 domain-containing protein [unclassified Streptomyces]|uniref:DUF397 domain-containing protein n=1 Tax=unclassified Streptomyces TaxID=2593676 RepID=UPI0033B55FF5
MSDRLAQPAPEWRRSSRSTGMNNCVEAARLGTGHLAVRDSKDTGLPPLSFSATAWTSFVAGLGGHRITGGRTRELS